MIQETWSFGTVEDPVSRESAFIGFAVYLPTFKDEPPRRKERKEDCFLLIRQERLRISNNLMPCGRSSLITLSCSWSLLFSGSSVYPVKYPSGISETYFTGVLIPKKEKSLAPLATSRLSFYGNFQKNKLCPLGLGQSRALWTRIFTNLGP